MTPSAETLPGTNVILRYLLAQAATRGREVFTFEKSLKKQLSSLQQA